MKSLIRSALGSAWAAPILRRIRQSALLADDMVPFEVQRFDRSEWVLKETASGFRIWCSLGELSISRPILLNRYELSETAFIEKNVCPGQTVVDAGANLGYHALHLASRTGADGCVYAFEPLPYIADALEASIAENHVESRVILQRVALDEKPGRLHLRHAPRTTNFGGAHLAGDEPLQGGHAEEVVETVRLDDVLLDRACAFIKIDVEGAEARVVRGANETLRRSRPVILSELHDRQLRIVSKCSASELVEQLHAIGYRCFLLTGDGGRGAEVQRYADDAPINVIFDPE